MKTNTETVAAVPSPIVNVAGYECSNCSKPIDITRSVLISAAPRRPGAKVKIWHPACKALLVLILAIASLTVVGCGGNVAGDVAGVPFAGELERPAPAIDQAPTLEGTWISRCEVTTTIAITPTDITIVSHVDGQADQILAGGYTVAGGHLVLNQDGAELDLGAFLLEGDTLVMAGAFAGIYARELE